MSSYKLYKGVFLFEFILNHVPFGMNSQNPNLKGKT